MRRLLPGYRLTLVLLLLPLLLPVLGFAPGAQTSEDEVRRVAQSVPEVEGILSHPTVEASARYDAPGD